MARKHGKAVAKQSRKALDNSMLNVYEESDDEKDNARSRTAETVDSYEFKIGEIGSDEDEEIDEDMAFNDSDEERYAGFKFYGGSSSGKRKTDVKPEDDGDDSDPENDDEDEDDDDGGMDLSDMLLTGTSMSDKPERDAASSADEADEDDLSASDQSSDDDGEDVDLMSLVSSLPTATKRKAKENAAASKRQRTTEVTEAYEASEHSVPSSRDSAKIDLNAMMGTLQDAKEFSGLEKQLQSLNKDTEQSRKLNAPLPQRVQDRLNRVAGYQEAKAEVTLWEPIVRKNREAEHLDFSKLSERKAGSSTAQLATTFKPQTELDAAIDQALRQSQQASATSAKDSDDLAHNPVDKKEVLARQAELRRMRELVFREEAKLKRMAKIKSKTYRKIQKKEKEKLRAQSKLSIAELMQVDPEAAREEILRLETERATERMSMRHKSNGKWSKFMLRQGSEGAEVTRQAIIEQMEQKEALKARIAGVPKRGDGEDGDSGSDADDHDASRSRDDLKLLESELATDPAVTKHERKGLMGMKFMQRALEAQKAKAAEMLEELKRDAEAEESERQAYNNDEQPKAQSKADTKAGRMALGPNANNAALAGQPQREHGTLQPEDYLHAADLTISSNAVSIFDRNGVASGNAKPEISVVQRREPVSKPRNTPATSKGQTAKAAPLQSEKKTAAPAHLEIDGQVADESNPWMQDGGGALKKAQSNGKDKQRNKGSAEKSVQKLKQAQKRADAEQSRLAEDDDQEDADVEAPMLFVAANTPEPRKGKAADGLQFTQRELVAAAFANDNVVAEFEQDKQDIVDEDAPKEQDLTKPGWGSWGGAGVPQRKTKKVVKRTSGVDASKRKDAKLQNVIINEKKQKKLAKFQTAVLPYPYKTREQYETAMRQSLGREWSSQTTFDSAIKPRIAVRSGVIIDPLRQGKIAKHAEASDSDDQPEPSELQSRPTAATTTAKGRRKATSRL
ncbi:hypothetical protein RI367_000633 [Sorochytrium milnesiophthora]